MSHTSAQTELLCFWELPATLWATTAQRKGRDTALSLYPHLWDIASTYTQHFLEAEKAAAELHVPKTIIKEIHQHPAGS